VFIDRDYWVVEGRKCKSARFFAVSFLHFLELPVTLGSTQKLRLEKYNSAAITRFSTLQLNFSHFDGVFSLFMGNEQVFGAYFDNFLPLSPRKSGVHTFLQKSHQLFYRSFSF
jgi:hypothetical protein